MGFGHGAGVMWLSEGRLRAWDLLWSRLMCVVLRLIGLKRENRTLRRAIWLSGKGLGLRRDGKKRLGSLSSLVGVKRSRAFQMKQKGEEMLLVPRDWGAREKV